MVLGDAADITACLLDRIQRASDSIQYHILLLVRHSVTGAIHKQEASFAFPLEGLEFPLDIAEHFIELNCRRVCDFVNVAVRNAEPVSNLTGVYCILLCRL